MSNRSKYLVQNIGILTISNFASRILVFLLVPLYTTCLSTEEVGIFDLVTTSISLIFPIFSLNIIDAITRFLLDKDNSKEEVALIGVKYILISLLPVSLFVMLNIKFSFFRQIHGYEVFILLYYISNCLNQYLVQFAKGMEMISVMGISGIIGTVSMLVANLVALLALKMGLVGFFVASIIGQTLPVLFLGIRTGLFQYIRFRRVNKVLQKDMLNFCTPLIVTATGWWINSASDKYAVSYLCGVEANGIFSVAYKIPAIMNTFQQIFIQAWQVSAIKEYGERDTAVFYGKVLSSINTFMVVLGSCVILFTRPLSYVLFKKEFYVAWKYVPFLVIASVINCASGSLGPILSAKKESKEMAKSALYGGGANLILNVLLIGLIGVQGATVATLIASFIIFSVRKKKVAEDITLDRFNRIFLEWLLLCFLSVLEIYTNYWVIEFIIVCMLLVINMKQIVNMINVVKGFIEK